MFKNAVIIAGGIGSRMRPITNYVPKPLVQVNEIPLIDYVINFFKFNKVNNIIVTHGYKGEMVLNYLGSKVEGFINTKDQDNAYFLFYSIIKHIKDPIIVCPCDILIELNLEEVYKEYIKLGEPPACIVPVETNFDADGIASKNNIITEISRTCLSKKYATGIQILNPYSINNLIDPETNFYGVWNALIKKKQLYVTDTMPTSWRIFDRLTDLP
jgi:NDP-sugar pyrophosphorylase family protein